MSANSLPQPGQMVEGRGIYLGTWDPNNDGNIVYAYATPDFLRGTVTGKPLRRTFYEAVDELTLRNGGRKYGNGTETALRKAIKDGTYQDGDLALGPLEFYNGKNVRGKSVRPGNNIYDLLRKAPAFKKILNTVNSSSRDGRWVVSGSAYPDGISRVYHARLTDGNDGWYAKDYTRSGVVPVRVFRTAPGLGG
jgi:hypothetical protein